MKVSDRQTQENKTNKHRNRFDQVQHVIQLREWRKLSQYNYGKMKLFKILKTALYVLQNTSVYFLHNINVHVLQNIYVNVICNNWKQLVNVIAIIYLSRPNFYCYIYLYLTFFTCFLCASEYRNNFERKLFKRKMFRATH